MAPRVKFVAWTTVAVAYAFIAWHGAIYLYETETSEWHRQMDQCRSDGGRVVENFFGPVIAVCHYDGGAGLQSAQ